MFKVFGKKPTGQRLARIHQSPNYKKCSFQNIEKTTVMLENASMMKLMAQFMNKPADVKPSHSIPMIKSDLKSLPTTGSFLVWFGHSSYFIRSNGFNILVDPIFSQNASPVSMFGKAFTGSTIFSTDDLPFIDLLLITHDHYDHLDYPTIRKLQGQVAKVLVPLGVGAHLEYWGYDPSICTELDWYQDVVVNDQVRITATPARHFSGRTIKRNSTLWTSYVLEVEQHKIFAGGDSGYSQQFKSIGDAFGPFDLAILECGQYGDNWPAIHMLPEETVQAAIDLRADVLLPVHWGKFVLALHAWDDPIKRVLQAALVQQMKVITPTPGDVYKLGSKVEINPWWELKTIPL